MKTPLYNEQKKAESRALELEKELRQVQELLQSGTRNEQGHYLAQVQQITARLAWALIECERYEDSYSLAKTLQWRAHAEDRYFCEGTALMYLGKLPEARALLEMGAQTYPDFIPILESLDICYTRLNEHGKALEVFEQAQRLLFDQAVYCYNNGFYEDAIEILQKLLTVRLRNPKIIDYGACHYLIGHSYNFMGYPEDARESYIKALAFGYDCADLYHGLCHTYYAQGMLSDAISACIEGIRKHPTSQSKNYKDLAYGYYYGMGWTSETLDVIQKGIEIFPDDDELKEWLNKIENDMKDPNKGNKDIKEDKPKIVLIVDQKKKKRVLP